MAKLKDTEIVGTLSLDNGGGGKIENVYEKLLGLDSSLNEILIHLNDKVTFQLDTIPEGKRITTTVEYTADDTTYIMKKIEVTGTVVRESSSEFVSIFSLTQLKKILGVESFDINNDFSINTWCGDGGGSGVHFYNCEWWSSPYNQIYQYFYPSKNGPVRINFKIQYTDISAIA